MTGNRTGSHWWFGEPWTAGAPPSEPSQPSNGSFANLNQLRGNGLHARLRASTRRLGSGNWAFHHLARPKQPLSVPLQPARTDPNRTSDILRLKITRGRTAIELPCTPGWSGTTVHAADTTRARLCVAVARREGERRRQPRAPRPACSEERPVPFPWWHAGAS